jgi:hypothetical protein
MVTGVATAANNERARQGKKVSDYVRAANDWYVEDARFVHALLDVEKFEGTSWDPACGGGNIPRILNGRDVSCIGTDLVDRGYGERRDFLAVTTDQPVDNIVSNPPFAVFAPWIEKSLALATKKVALVGRLTILEGIERGKLIDRTPLARVWVSRRRVSMPPGGTDIKPAGGKHAYAWFVWEHGHVGPPTIRGI